MSMSGLQCSRLVGIFCSRHEGTFDGHLDIVAHLMGIWLSTFYRDRLRSMLLCCPADASWLQCRLAGSVSWFILGAEMRCHAGWAENGGAGPMWHHGMLNLLIYFFFIRFFLHTWCGVSACEAHASC